MISLLEITAFAKTALKEALVPLAGTLGNTVMEAGKEAAISTAAGKLSLDEWSRVACKSVDEVKEYVAENSDLTFAGGKLIFSQASNGKDVNVSFKLYCQDESEKWHLVEAGSDIRRSKFTTESLLDIQTEKEIVFDVE